MCRRTIDSHAADRFPSISLSFHSYGHFVGARERRRFMAYETVVDGARFSSGRKGKREEQICLSFAVNVSRGVI